MTPWLTCSTSRSNELVLLDTVAVYRAATSPEALSPAARAALEDPSHALFVSLVSAWELAIKASLGKLALPAPIADFFPQIGRDLLARQLGLELTEIAKVAWLPHHHSDPFDRLDHRRKPWSDNAQWSPATRASQPTASR